MLEGIVLHVGIAVQSTLRTAIRSRVAHAAAADGRRGLRERQHGVAAAATAQTTDGRTECHVDRWDWETYCAEGQREATRMLQSPSRNALTSQQISEFFLSWQHDVL